MSTSDKVKINKTIHYLKLMDATNTNPYVDGRLYLFLNDKDNFVSSCPASYSRVHEMYNTAHQRNIQFKQHLNQLTVHADKNLIISIGLFYHKIDFIDNKFSHDTSIVNGHSCLAIISNNTIEIVDSSYSNLPQFKYFENKLILGLSKNLRMLSVNKNFKKGELLTNTPIYNIQEHTKTDILCSTWSSYFCFLLHSHNWTRQQLLQYIHENKHTLLDRLLSFLRIVYNTCSDHIDEMNPKMDYM